MRGLLLITLCSVGCTEASSRPPAAPAEAPITLVAVTAPAQELAVPAKTVQASLKVGGMPERFAVDGDLSEWGTPSIQAQGSALWIAAGSQGVAVALRLERPADPSFELAMPLPPLPAIGFANQMGPILVPDISWCETAEQQFIPDAAAAARCRTWFDAQLALRRELEAQFRVSLKGAKKSSDGLQYEVLLPFQDLPPLTTAQLESFQIELALPGAAPLYKIDVALADPVRVAPLGSLLELVLKERVVPLEQAAYYRVKEPQIVHWLLNEWIGYQWTPEAPSPAQVDVDLSQRTFIAQQGEILVETVLAEPSIGAGSGQLLVSTRGGRVVDTLLIRGGTPQPIALGAGLNLLVVYQGPQSWLGTGMCGLCENIRVDHVVMNGEGKFGEPENLLDHGGWGQEELELTIVKKPAAVRITYTLSDDAATPPVTERRSHVRTWNAAKKGFDDQSSRIRQP